MPEVKNGCKAKATFQIQEEVDADGQCHIVKKLIAVSTPQVCSIF